MGQRQLSAPTQSIGCAPSQSRRSSKRHVAKKDEEPLQPKRPLYPLYDPAFEHDACGTGFLANISGHREHRIVERALEALANLAHRGAMDADAETSDGAGIMTQLPHRIFTAWLAARGSLPIPPDELAVGMFFLPRHAAAAAKARRLVNTVIERRGMQVAGWRVVPVSKAALGRAARGSCPRIEQIVVRRVTALTPADFERALYLVRKEVEARCKSSRIADVYIASLSSRSIVYKGLVTAANLPRLYPDLRNPQFESALALFHQRYSTNTFPSWPLAQPLRLLAHNGEINTVQGNRHWIAAREPSFETLWGEDAQWLPPVIDATGSDSTSLDNVLELLTRSGRDLPAALTLLVPEAWEGRDDLDDATRAFFQSQAPLTEPWDGPAALVFSDGQVVGAALDRNGLRPLRYVITADGVIVVASEVGVIALDESQIVEKGRLGPGQLLALDTATGTLRHNGELKKALTARQPYAEWTRRHIISVETPDASEPSGRASLSDAELLEKQALYGYSHEDVELVLRPMVGDGQEPVWSMGDDTPLSALSQQPRPLSTYFKQRFAQVTNPPIDSLREQAVMSLTTYLGRRGDLLKEREPDNILLKLASPILDKPALADVLAAAENHHLASARIPTTYTPDAMGNALQATLDHLEAQVVAAAQSDVALLLLSDRDISAHEAPIPMPLALATAHQALMRAGLRPRVGLIVETGAVWDVHQLALLIGYGANAVCPYLAFATAHALAGSRGFESVSPALAERRYSDALRKGLLKVMARMGLSVIESYLGAQLFECLGLAPELVARYFTGTPTSLGALTLADLDRQTARHKADADRLTEQRHEVAESETVKAAQRLRLADRGYVRFRRSAEYHSANPLVVKALQQAAESGDREGYQRYTELVYQRPPTAIRDLLIIRDGQPIPLEDVEPAEQITRRFVSTAMSLGSLSPEAHQTLTLGANRVGARSNTGEGGEDPAWRRATRDGVSLNNRIKQIASGRFGVTTDYLAHAEEIEIKMAQGSKPGEGGQLPARKVTGLIARLRHTSPGVSLISPPPHHDIYSIEDLAQLIYDLKQVNPRAAVGVKLVASRGVGTVAAGVAKAHADYILISGHDGGTGASPLSSIKSVGIPWELGLAETQQALRINGLRGRVRLRTDGGLKTGRDIVVAALLGADEFAFGTAALIALGCDMARQCHLDTCPAGIATQREDLRQRFTGRPEHVAAFLLAVAEEVRGILASLGTRSLDEIIGRVDLLSAVLTAENATPLPSLDLAPLLASGEEHAPRRYQPVTVSQPSFTSASLPEQDLLDEVAPLLERGGYVLLHGRVRNSDRAVGARLSGEIARRWGDSGLPNGGLIWRFAGSAGQSFGAFCVPGLRLMLEGDANDYVAKGMTGGEVFIMPPTHHRFVAHEQVILGNTVLYGATGGLLLAAGRAGERFAVRNSGAVAVVEGMGDHGCEYMTGGAVLSLGPTGRNFGAGMSGGVAYVYDEDDALARNLNTQMVRLQRLEHPSEIEDIKALIRYHQHATHSARAAQLLADWPTTVSRFWRVSPQNAPSVEYSGETLAPFVTSLHAPSDGYLRLRAPHLQRTAI